MQKMTELTFYGSTGEFFHPRHRSELTRIMGELKEILGQAGVTVLRAHAEWIAVLKIMIILHHAGERQEDGSKSMHQAQCTLRDACEVMGSFSCIKYVRKLTQREDQEYARETDDCPLYVDGREEGRLLNGICML